MMAGSRSRSPRSAPTSTPAKMRARTIAGISAERIADELRKMLVDRHRARGMGLFLDLGLAAAILPELLPMKGMPHGLPRADATLPPPGRSGDTVDDLWTHVLRVLDLLGP